MLELYFVLQIAFELQNHCYVFHFDCVDLFDWLYKDQNHLENRTLVQVVHH